MIFVQFRSQAYYLMYKDDFGDECKLVTVVLVIEKLYMTAYVDAFKRKISVRDVCFFICKQKNITV